VIAMTMRDVDRRQLPVLRGDPIRERIGLHGGHERINEDGISLPVDQGRRRRLKERLVYIGRLVGHLDRYARHEHVPVQWL